MWNEFSDYELAQLCYNYGIEEELVWSDHLVLANRPYIETLLTEFEYDMAYGE